MMSSPGTMRHTRMAMATAFAVLVTCGDSAVFSPKMDSLEPTRTTTTALATAAAATNTRPSINHRKGRSASDRPVTRAKKRSRMLSIQSSNENKKPNRWLEQEEAEKYDGNNDDSNNDDSNDDGSNGGGSDDDDYSLYSAYATGYISALSCRSYRIALSEDYNDYYTYTGGQYQREQRHDEPGEKRSPTIIGQETVLWFDYVLDNSSDNTDDDDNDYDDYYSYNGEEENEQGEKEENNNRSRRKLEDEGDGVQGDDEEEVDQYDYNYNSNYNSHRGNIVLAKDWLAAHSGGTLTSGCQQLLDPLDVFEDYVPSMDDGRLVFSNLYYGPMCSDSNSNTTVATVEMGIFLDSSCHAHLPGLTYLLNHKVLSDWMTGVPVGNSGTRSSGSSNGSSNENDEDNAMDGSSNEFNDRNPDDYMYEEANDDFNDIDDDSDSSSKYQNDLKRLNSYRTLVHQLNYYYNRDPTDCSSHQDVCGQILQKAIDLNSCRSVDQELETGAYAYYGDQNGDDDSTAYYDDAYNNDGQSKSQSGDEKSADYIDDNAVQEQAQNYGAFVEVDDGIENSNDEENICYQIFQNVLEQYSSRFSSNEGDDDANRNENGDEGDYDEQEDAEYYYEGICYGILEMEIDSSSQGCSLENYYDLSSSNKDDDETETTNTAWTLLQQELEEVYGIKDPNSIDLLALFGIALGVVCLLGLLAWGVDMATKRRGSGTGQSRRQSAHKTKSRKSRSRTKVTKESSAANKRAAPLLGDEDRVGDTDPDFVEDPAVLALASSSSSKGFLRAVESIEAVFRPEDRELKSMTLSEGEFA